MSGSNGGTKPEATATPIRSRPCIHPRPLPRARRNNSYAGRRERDLLKSFYYFLHQSAPAGAAAPAGQSAAALAVAEAYRAAEWKQRRKGLEIALGFYREETGGRDAAGGFLRRPHARGRAHQALRSFMTINKRRGHGGRVIILSSASV